MQAVITPVSTQERAKLGIRPGDTVRVHQKVMEKGKTRLQMFEGLVIAVKHGNEAGGTFTVRAQLSGIGVEKIFPLYSPVIDKIEITKRSKVRRAKLYFIREKVAREVRRQLRNMRMVNMSTEDYKEEPAPEEIPAETEAEVVEKDPAQTPDQTEMTPAEEAGGAEEAPAVEEPSLDAPTEEVVPEEKKEEAA
ncbi:MAG: ribosomal protein large subunit ribosomal protein [Parcubacteria group bacterium]|nr:ribosomal protein large subunit ribosomal protein [Parcubacteria group bacterium]